MHALPWGDDTFDVVTSFRGIWGTTPDAVAEARRVLRPGGRLGLTVWGHIKASPGRVGARAVHAGQAGEGRQPGGDGEPRASRCRRGAAGQLGIRGRPTTRDPVRVGVRRPRPLRPRARLDRPGLRGDPGRGRGGIPGPRPRERRRSGCATGYRCGRSSSSSATSRRNPSTASRPREDEPSGSFLAAAPASAAADQLRQEDLDELGYVMNSTRLWAHMPATVDGLFELLGHCVKAGRLDMRTRGILVAATASTLGDSYCSLAWGGSGQGRRCRTRRRRAGR